MARYRCALIWLGLAVGEVWSHASTAPEGGRKVRTLYACVGENNSELSFEPNQIIDNDPVCNMSAFLKQARVCWKEAAVYSDKPEGICAHKVDAMFRRCLVRVTKLSSCEDDERAKQRIRGEVDSQRAHCVGASAHRAAAVSLSLPSAASFLFAGATLLALCGLPAN